MIAFSSVARFQGKRYLFKDADFQVNPGDRVGLVGPNGAGKTTVFRLITRQETPDEGTITIPERFVVGYFSQEPGGDVDATVLEAAMAGCAEIQRLQAEIDACTARLSDPELDADQMETVLVRLGEAQEGFEARGGYDLDSRAKVVLGGLGFSEEDLAKPVAAFSGGWRMRIELAKVLLQQPDALVLDEPTNHLDLESIVWLEDWLNAYKGAIIMTSHDRDFLNRLTSKIMAIEFGTINTYAGTYDFYEAQTQERLENLEAAAKRQDAMFAKEERFIERFTTHAAKAAQVQSRKKMLDKIERIEVPQEARAVKFQWPDCPRSGEVIATLTGVAKAYGPRRVLEGTSFQIKRLDRIAVLGCNGAGKSTLLKIIAGALDADGGECKMGASLAPAYFAQHQTEILDPKLTVFQAVQEVAPTKGRSVIQNILGSVLFSGDDVEKQVGILSGGEKTRVVLARILANPVNFLILDEPTNHLDLRTREILLDALKKFEGTVLFVSHDRHFLRDVATKVILLDGGTTTEYHGGIEYFLEKNAGRFPGSGHTLRVG